MYKVYSEDGAGNEFIILESFKNELLMVPFKILGIAENVELLGNFVKFEPILRIFVKILKIKIWADQSSAIRVLSPSAEINV